MNLHNMVTHYKDMLCNNLMHLYKVQHEDAIILDTFTTLKCTIQTLLDRRVT